MHKGGRAVVHVVDDMREGLGVWERQIEDRVVGVGRKETRHARIQ